MYYFVIHCRYTPANFGVTTCNIVNHFSKFEHIFCLNFSKTLTLIQLLYYTNFSTYTLHIFSIWHHYSGYDQLCVIVTTPAIEI